MSNATPKRFKIKETTYEFGSVNDITLRDLLLVEEEVAQLGRTLHMGEVTRLAELFKGLSKDEVQHHPEGGWMLAVTIWMSMVRHLRDRGDYTTQVPFASAIDFELKDFTPIAEPTDRAKAARPDPQKPARKASGPAAKTAAAKG